jgi:soluble lytic murein transglycosylase-like protein
MGWTTCGTLRKTCARARGATCWCVSADLRLALAAYNAGAGAVVASGNRIPAYAETRSYVPRALEQMDRFRARAAL